MRPYLAIIKDSFRAALASRVLYVLLLLITLLLLFLAPLSVRQTLDWRLVRELNVKNCNQLIKQLVTRREENPQVQRVWDLLPRDLQKRLLKRAEPKGDKTADQGNEVTGQLGLLRELELQEDLIEELNTIIARDDFYKAEIFGRQGLNSEARELLDQGLEKLSPIQKKRLNRLVLAATFAPQIDRGNPSAMDLHYAIWTFPYPIQMTQQQFSQLLLSYLPYYFDKFVLSIGLLIAIVVTANMVPETFEPGSLNLLLSKPISRWGLFSAKFFGGCVFIALCAAYLFAGLWLWLGLGMGVWDRAILLSIPLYIIVFAIYFSVSALIGLLYRSAIVSVILTLVFWAICTLLGWTYGSFRVKAANDEMLALIPVGEKLLSCDLTHQVSVWDQQKRSWEPRQTAQLDIETQTQLAVATWIAPLRYEGDFPGLRDFVKPVFDSRNKRVLCSSMVFRFGMTQEKQLYAANLDDLNFHAIGSLPTETLKLFETANGIIAITGAGQVHRLNEQAVDKFFAELETETKSAADPSKPNPNSKKPKAKLKAEELFRSIGPKDAEFIRNRNLVDYSPSRDEFACYEYGKLHVYRNTGTSYERRETKQLKLDFNTNMTAMLAFGKDRIAIAFGNGQVLIVDANSLETVDDCQLENRSGVLEIATSSDGERFGVLYRNGNLWLQGPEKDAPFEKPNLTGQGSICTFALGDGCTCWVGYDSDRVAQHDLSSGSRVNRLIPTGNFIGRLYRWLIRPLYWVFPKPGEFYKVVTHLASNSDASANKDLDRNKAQEVSDPWGPLRSGLLFMFGMLALSCTLFHFKDY